MIIVTGGAGFIGSNLIKGLNQQGYDKILVVDHLKNGHKFKNIVDCSIIDYLDKSDFLKKLETQPQLFRHVKACFHEGACSDTTEWDGEYLLPNNYNYSRTLLDHCLEQQIPFYYASSAAVYGAGTTFKEELPYESPINLYAYSKYLFDQYVRQVITQARSPIVGLRYFNVYGPREAHKGKMASVAWHFHQQISKEGIAKLFDGTNGYGPGEQRRDFVYVGDVVDVNLWFLTHPQHSGIFNVGTGRSQSFNEVVNSVISFHQSGAIEYIPFPDSLKASYQSFTEADLTRLRAVGYTRPFQTVEEGVLQYLTILSSL